MWSQTFRELARLHHGVEIGIHSYGPCLLAGELPAGTRIGNYCSLAGGITVLRRNHPIDRICQHPLFFNATCGLLDRDTIPGVEENPLTIGHDVWIGQNVIVAPGCRNIGDGAVVAAGAVVTVDVPPLAIVGGVPAKLIRWRFTEDLRANWLESHWWLKPLSELGSNLQAFTQAFSPADSPGCKCQPIHI